MQDALTGLGDRLFRLLHGRVNLGTVVNEAEFTALEERPGAPPFADLGLNPLTALARAQVSPPSSPASPASLAALHTPDGVRYFLVGLIVGRRGGRFTVR